MTSRSYLHHFPSLPGESGGALSLCADDRRIAGQLRLQLGRTSTLHVCFLLSFLHWALDSGLSSQQLGANRHRPFDRRLRVSTMLHRGVSLIVVSEHYPLLYRYTSPRPARKRFEDLSSVHTSSVSLASGGV
jgi:hypothetical protein